MVYSISKKFQMPVPDSLCFVHILHGSLEPTVIREEKCAISPSILRRNSQHGRFSTCVHSWHLLSRPYQLDDWLSKPTFHTVSWCILFYFIWNDDGQNPLDWLSWFYNPFMGLKPIKKIFSMLFIYRERNGEGEGVKHLRDWETPQIGPPTEPHRPGLKPILKTLDYNLTPAIESQLRWM